MTKFSVRYNLLATAAYLLSCCLLFSCENDQQEIDRWTRNDILVEEAFNIETYVSQGGRMRAKLWSPYMLRHSRDTQYLEFPRTVKADFFDTANRRDSHLDSKYGKYYETLNRVFLRDSVLVYNIYGDTLQTPALWWDQNTQRFYTDQPVRIRKSGHLIIGVGMEAKQDLTDIHIRNITNSVLQVADSIGR